MREKTSQNFTSYLMNLTYHENKIQRWAFFSIYIYTFIFFNFF